MEVQHSEESVPRQCFTWTGISSLEHAQDVLTQFHVSVGHGRPHSSAAHKRLPALYSQCTSNCWFAAVVTVNPTSSSSAPALSISAVNVLYKAKLPVACLQPPVTACVDPLLHDADAMMCSGGCDCHKL